jgi:hypothetical protein
MKIGILLIATGKYIQFFPDLYQGLKRLFFPNIEKRFFLWTDATINDCPKDIIVTFLKQRGHPADTLFRYHYFLQNEAQLQSSVDIVYYMDIDTSIIELIQDDSLLPTDTQPLIVTQHPGFCDQNFVGTPERRIESTAYVSPHSNMMYVCGGFNGGKTKEFLQMSRVISNNIDMDTQKGITAIWHDESHLNKYYSNHSQLFKTLPPSYMYPQGFNGTHGRLFQLPAKLVALDKHHIKDLRLVESNGENKKSVIDLTVSKKKIGVIIYHSDIHKIYKKRWYVKCLDSILDQTFQDFDILELAYGTECKESLLQYCTDQSKVLFKTVYFWNEPLKNHAFAMNFLLDKAFTDMNYDYIFNVNLDDYYHPERFERQLAVISCSWIDLVSSNFSYIQEDTSDQERDIITNTIDVYNLGGCNFTRCAWTLLVENTNLIAHPAVCFKKSFWRKFSDLCYADEIPREDLELWKRSMKHQLKFKILPQVLLYYRRHSNQICK